MELTNIKALLMSKNTNTMTYGETINGVDHMLHIIKFSDNTELKIRREVAQSVETTYPHLIIVTTQGYDEKNINYIDEDVAIALLNTYTLYFKDMEEFLRNADNYFNRRKRYKELNYRKQTHKKI